MVVTLKQVLVLHATLRIYKYNCIWASCIQIVDNMMGLFTSYILNFFGTDSSFILISGGRSVQGPVLTYPSEIDGIPKMSLPVFGLASYKFRGSLWTPNGRYEWQLAKSLLQDAEDWLRQRQVNHPDFLFFRRRWSSGNVYEI